MEKDHLVKISESCGAGRRMEKNEVLRLTKNLYGLTALFPKKEPLKYKMREAAIDILAEPKTEGIEVLDSFFEVAKAQRWVKEIDMLAIQQEYAKLKAELTEPEADERQLSLPTDLLNVQNEKIPAEKEKLKESATIDAEAEKEKEGVKMGSMLERQEKIMDFLKENGRAQVWQTKQILPEVTKRTLRRDFEQMLRKGLIERTGERNGTYYQVKTPSRSEGAESQ